MRSVDCRRSPIGSGSLALDFFLFLQVGGHLIWILCSGFLVGHLFSLEPLHGIPLVLKGHLLDPLHEIPLVLEGHLLDLLHEIPLVLKDHLLDPLHEIPSGS